MVVFVPAQFLTEKIVYTIHVFYKKKFIRKWAQMVKILRKS